MAKKAVVVGCNYPGMPNELHGCVNDACSLYNILVTRFGFECEDVKLLVDDDELISEGVDYEKPTGAAIRDALEKMVWEAKPGDTFFFSFSGHGGRNEVDDPNEIDDTGFDECIYPTDFDLLDDDYFRNLLCSLPSGATFTMISDSCQSGGLIDQAKEQIGNSFQQLPEEAAIVAAREQALAGQGATDDDDVDNVNNNNNNIDEEEGSRGLKRKDLPAEVVAQILREMYGRDDIDARNVGAKAREIFGRDKKKKTRTKKTKTKKKKKNSKKKAASGSSSDSSDSSSSSDDEDEDDHNNKKKKKKNKDDELGDYESMAAAVGGGAADAAEAASGGGLQAGILVSGCQSHQTSTDDQTLNPPRGALTHAIVTLLQMLEPDEPISNGELVIRVRRYLSSQGHTQQPGLYCADDKVNAPFVCHPLAPALE